jgi:hypothetical protein
MRSIKAGLRLSIIRYLAAAYRVSLDLYPDPFQIRVDGRNLRPLGLTLDAYFAECRGRTVPLLCRTFGYVCRVAIVSLDFLKRGLGAVL